MRRFVTVMVSVVLSAGVVGVAPAGAVTPPVESLTEGAFADQLEASVAAFAQSQAGNTVEIVRASARQHTTVTVNADGSFMIVQGSKDPEEPKTTGICLAPVPGQGTECFLTTLAGKWYRTDSIAVIGAKTSTEIVEKFLLDDVMLLHTRLVKDAKALDVDPVYAQMTVDGVLMLTESASTPELGVSTVYSFPPGAMDAARETTETGRSMTLSARAVEPVAVTRPARADMDMVRIVTSDLGVIASQLEVVFNATGKYPSGSIRASVDPDVKFRVCYDRVDDPTLFMVLGTADGGATYWRYRSAHDGLEREPVRTKSGVLPQCSSVKENAYNGSETAEAEAAGLIDKPRPMVAGPRVYATDAPAKGARVVSAEEFTSRVDARVNRFTRSLDGGAAETRDPFGMGTGREVTSTVWNPDASSVTTVTGKTDYVTDMPVTEVEMCLAPGKDGKRDCFKQVDDGKWVNAYSYGEYSPKLSGAAIAGAFFRDDVNSMLEVVVDYSTERGVTPVYSIKSGKNITVYEILMPGVVVTFWFGDGWASVQATESGRVVTSLTVLKADPVEVFRPSGDQMDWDAILKSNLNDIAKALETVYVNEDALPLDVVEVQVSEGSQFRVCYNSATAPHNYLILGSRDGGASYYLYDSVGGGLQEKKGESKSGKFPSCGSLKNADGVKMVNGPKVVIGDYYGY